MSRLGTWLLGANSGFRSVDNIAHPDSVENRRKAVRFILQLNAGSGVISGAALTLLAVFGPHLPGSHLRLGAVILVSALLILTPASWATIQRVPIWWMHPMGILVETVVFAGMAYSFGPSLGMGIVLAFIMQGTSVFLVAHRRAGMLHVAMMGATYAFVLATQKGNPAPVARWVLAMGALILLGMTVAQLVDRMRSLALAESVAHAKADAAQAETAALNATLELRVAEQVGELARFGRMRRFLSTPVADAVLSSDTDELLAPHRGEISVFFCDLRGFTAFAGTSQPEDVHLVLGEYFDLLGQLVRKYEATVGAFTGDGLMAFFNDPLPCPDPALTAIQMGVDLRSAMDGLLTQWRRKGYDLGFGIGISLGYADIGVIGFEGRRDYSALGSVVNLASRLCGEAQSGEILIDQRSYVASEEKVAVGESSAFMLKGFHQPVQAFPVLGIKD